MAEVKPLVRKIDTERIERVARAMYEWQAGPRRVPWEEYESPTIEGSKDYWRALAEVALREVEK